MKRNTLTTIILFFYLALLRINPAIAEVEENEYLNMDISQLMQVTITSVAKKPQPLSDAAAAVFVITSEDITNSGVTSIPEALRLAPGLQVARISSSKWAISSRGLNGNFANKLLVMIDGRTVYNPLFSGTYWDMQNTFLEDIERIEVIRGPGATMWGANAVNGVINIITKHAKDTTGTKVTIGSGDHEDILAATRFGFTIADGIHGRLYALHNKRDSFDKWKDGKDANDDWKSSQAGFRLDGISQANNNWTIQGDYYEIDEDQIIEPFYIESFPYITEDYGKVDGKGWNVLGRWEHKFSADSSLKFQSYFDSMEREESFATQTHKTFDMDLQYENILADIHNITIGAGYRNIDTTFMGSFQVSADPTDRNDDLYSGFIQDVITLEPDSLFLTLGSKWEHNDYTGNEYQPTARLLWKTSETQTLWGSISRAVRTPSQADRAGSITFSVDPTLPPYPAVFPVKGTKQFDSEKVIAYEAGYRYYPNNAFSTDIDLFHLNRHYL